MVVNVALSLAEGFDTDYIARRAKRSMEVLGDALNRFTVKRQAVESWQVKVMPHISLWTEEERHKYEPENLARRLSESNNHIDQRMILDEAANFYCSIWRITDEDAPYCALSEKPYLRLVKP